MVETDKYSIFAEDTREILEKALSCGAVTHLDFENQTDYAAALAFMRGTGELTYGQMRRVRDLCENALTAQREQTLDSFGKVLERELSKRGMSMSALAREIGVTRQVIHDYTRGRTLPSLAVFARIADALDVSADTLLGRSKLK